MCGRYYVPDEDSAADLREIIEQINRRANAGPVVKTGEIAPSDRPKRDGGCEGALSGRYAASPVPCARGALFRVGKAR